jgi:predicted ArsR family transcriptional regulator
MSIPKETRRESYGAICPSLRRRQRIVLTILRDYGDMTAQEVADTLCYLRITPTNERNFAAPRLTELCDMGLVAAVGKEVCRKSGRTVTVWSAVKNAKADKPKPAEPTQLQIELSMKIWLDSLERGGKQKSNNVLKTPRNTNPSAFLHMGI